MKTITYFTFLNNNNINKLQSTPSKMLLHSWAMGCANLNSAMYFVLKPLQVGVRTLTSLLTCFSSRERINTHIILGLYTFLSFKPGQGFHLPVSVPIWKRKIFNKSFKICNRKINFINWAKTENPLPFFQSGSHQTNFDAFY